MMLQWFYLNFLQILPVHASYLNLLLRITDRFGTETSFLTELGNLEITCLSNPPIRTAQLTLQPISDGQPPYVNLIGSTNVSNIYQIEIRKDILGKKLFCSVDNITSSSIEILYILPSNGSANCTNATCEPGSFCMMTYGANENLSIICQPITAEDCLLSSSLIDGTESRDQVFFRMFQNRYHQWMSSDGPSYQTDCLIRASKGDQYGFLCADVCTTSGLLWEVYSERGEELRTGDAIFFSGQEAKHYQILHRFTAYNEQALSVKCQFRNKFAHTLWLGDFSQNVTDWKPLNGHLQATEATLTLPNIEKWLPDIYKLFCECYSQSTTYATFFYIIKDQYPIKIPSLINPCIAIRGFRCADWPRAKTPFQITTSYWSNSTGHIVSSNQKLDLNPIYPGTYTCTISVLNIWYWPFHSIGHIFQYNFTYLDTCYVQQPMRSVAVDDSDGGDNSDSVTIGLLFAMATWGVFFGVLCYLNYCRGNRMWWRLRERIRKLGLPGSN